MSALASSRSPISRFWQVIKTWEAAFDYSGQDYLFDRLTALESEVASLKAELDNRVSRAGEKHN